MTSWPLYRLIVFNLLEINLSNFMVFHCWSIKEAFPLVQMLNQNGIFSQYIDLQNPDNLANVHKEYLDSDLVRLGVFLDLGCDKAELVTNQSSRARLYNQNLHWLLYDEAGNFTKLVQLFKAANLSLNADVTYVSRQDEERFILHDVYNKGSHLGGKLNITVDQTLQCNRSHCQVKEYLSELHLRPRLQHRMDLSSVTFRLAALVSVLPINSSEEELLEFLNSDRDSHMDSISRIGNRLIMHTQEILGFKLHYIWCGTWSVQDAFGGAIGMLTNESAELCTTPFVPSWNRLHYVHPMTEQAQFRAVCMFRTPHNSEIKAAVFLEPFMPSVWFAFAGLLIFAGVLLWIIFHLERHWMQRCLDFIPSLLSSCLISFGAACIQGSYFIPKSAGGRLAFIAVMLTSFLMYNYYTSIVVSTLLGSPVRSNIRTIQQLADSSLDVGFDTVPFTKTYLVSSPRPDIRSLYKQKVESKRDPNSVWLSPEEGVIRVRDQPGFVYTSEASFMYHFVEKHYLPREISDLNEIILRPESAVYGMVHLNSTYRQLLTQLQVRMLETGITSKQSRFFSKTKLHTFSNSFVIQVGMEYAASLFISLLVAYFLALLILILEICWARYARKKFSTIIP
ncbi:ionotropic receptor 75a [Drosophila sechellia]|uniref:Ionotropic receptor 75a n=1 Tax=Drosophila sechellia TaxID=7238 RepID=A0A1S6EMV6_DROSE|nr:ionotropic receptor 75a [Drosophila sechellia]AQR59319.1 ionotropic receptor 75c [Drosophila sechellia]